MLTICLGFSFTVSLTITTIVTDNIYQAFTKSQTSSALPELSLLIFITMRWELPIVVIILRCEKRAQRSYVIYLQPTT